MISNENLQQWRALADAATPGPWSAETGHGETGPNYIDSPSGVVAYVYDSYRGTLPNAEADAAFIAAAREAVPALLAEVDRLRRELASYERHAAYVAGVVEEEGRYIP